MRVTILSVTAAISVAFVGATVTMAMLSKAPPKPVEKSSRLVEATALDHVPPDYHPEAVPMLPVRIVPIIRQAPPVQSPPIQPPPPVKVAAMVDAPIAAVPEPAEAPDTFRRHWHEPSLRHHRHVAELGGDICERHHLHKVTMGKTWHCR